MAGLSCDAVYIHSMSIATTTACISKPAACEKCPLHQGLVSCSLQPVSSYGVMHNAPKISLTVAKGPAAHFPTGSKLWMEELQVLQTDSHAAAAAAAACRHFELPVQKLLPRDMSSQYGADHALWSMYAFVALVYGLVVPLVLLYIKEVHFRGELQQ